MNINATLILQSIAMMIFVWFCMKFVWPPLLKAMDERREKIADGLAASDRAEKALVEANSAQRHSQILDQAKDDATAERQRQVTAGEAEITQAANQAREELRSSVASIAVLGAQKILEKEIDADAHRDLIDKLIAEI
jgi:F-type H+-transporting ATPase subunit b